MINLKAMVTQINKSAWIEISEADVKEIFEYVKAQSDKWEVFAGTPLPVLVDAISS